MDLLYKAFESFGKFLMSSPYFLPCLAIAGFFAFQFLMILPVFLEVSSRFLPAGSCHFSLLLSVELQTAPKETPCQLEHELDGPALPPSGREGKGREEMRNEEEGRGD